MLNFKQVRWDTYMDDEVYHHIFKREDIESISFSHYNDVGVFRVYLTDGEIREKEMDERMSEDITFDGIKVEGHRGIWGTIDFQMFYEHGNRGKISGEEPKLLMLLEHETYGDEAACIIIDLDGNVILEDVWNGWDDYEDYLVDMEGDGGQW